MPENIHYDFLFSFLSSPKQEAVTMLELVASAINNVSSTANKSDKCLHLLIEILMQLESFFQ